MAWRGRERLNFDGPNYETDGWGLVLWAARQYLESSCDLDWLDSTTRQGDTVYEALLHIGEDIRASSLTTCLRRTTPFGKFIGIIDKSLLTRWPPKFGDSRIFRQLWP